MILIACVDDDGGMMFNKRRQSRDSAVTKRIADISAGGVLWVSGYTEELFADLGCSNIRVADDPALCAGPGEFCFLEETSPGEFADRAEKLVIFRWNRRYPSDVKFDIDPDEKETVDGYRWKKESSADFAGTSHEKITEEIYTK
ncbi:MAG: ribonuclease Z [Eubacteriaceae bacterium]|jgi:hypothetical protein|nr:ribonuclease Z [Eubacteriaceae bacterium]